MHRWASIVHLDMSVGHRYGCEHELHANMEYSHKGNLVIKGRKGHIKDFYFFEASLPLISLEDQF